MYLHIMLFFSKYNAFVIFIIGNSSSCSANEVLFLLKKQNETCKIGKMFLVTKQQIIQLLEPSLYANFVGD